jgi:hypothetical protein
MNNYTIPESELKLAESIVKLAESDKIVNANVSSLVIEGILKQFNIIAPVCFANNEDEEYEEIPAAIAAIQSGVIKKMYQYDGKIKIPRFVYDRLLFKNLKISGKDIFDMMVYGDQYDIRIEKNVDWSTLTVDDLLYYIKHHKCANIDKNTFRSVRILVSLYFMNQIHSTSKYTLEPCNCNPCQISNCKQYGAYSYNHKSKCKYYSSPYLCKEYCINYLRFIVLPPLIEFIVSKLSYNSIYDTYNKIINPGLYPMDKVNKINISVTDSLLKDIRIFKDDSHKYMINYD